MVLPTTQNRIKVLDVARGLAILGILLANITAFGEPFLAVMFSPTLPPRSPEHTLFDQFTMLLVNGKFRSMLAILFGVGLYLQFRKREPVVDAAPPIAGQPAEAPKKDFKAWPGGYLKRTAWLFALGLIHGYFIWFGDILGTYAIVAVAACFLVRISDKAMAWTIGLLAANAVLTAIVQVAFSLYFVNQPANPDNDMTKLFPALAPAAEMAAYQTGTYLQQLGYRAAIYSFSLLMAFFIGFILLPLFLLGVVFGRAGFLQAPSRFPVMRKWCLLIGFGLGIPINLVAFLPMSPKVAETVQMGLIEMLGGPVMSVGYLTLIAMFVEKGWLSVLGNVFARIGKVALSAYLLQSVVCTFIFYSWGLGYFGELGPGGWLTVVAIAWAIDLAFAYAWLHFFRMGPVEWLWRSLTESKILPLRRTA